MGGCGGGGDGGVQLENDQPYPGLQRAVVPTEVRDGATQQTKHLLVVCVCALMTQCLIFCARTQ